jgi:hypothetical protein
MPTARWCGPKETVAVRGGGSGCRCKWRSVPTHGEVGALSRYPAIFFAAAAGMVCSYRCQCRRGQGTRLPFLLAWIRGRCEGGDHGHKRTREADCVSYHERARSRSPPQMAIADGG